MRRRVITWGGQRRLENPRLVAEVLSPSTRDYDLAGKFAIYQQIPELEDYLLVEVEQARVMHWRKDGIWRLTEYLGLAARVPLVTLPGELPLRELYDGVTV